MGGVQQILFKILICGDNSWNAPFWMLRSIFAGSIIVYILIWIRENMTNIIGKIIIILVALLFSYLIFGSTAFMVIIGASLFWLERYIVEINKWIWIPLFVFSLFMVYGIHHWLYEVINNMVGLSRLFDYTIMGRMIYSTIMFVAVRQSSELQKMFMNKIFIELGNISYSIFLIHWPLMCSFSAWLLCNMSNNYTINFWVILVITIIALLCVSYLYQKTVGKCCELLCKRTKTYLKI